MSHFLFVDANSRGSILISLGKLYVLTRFYVFYNLNLNLHKTTDHHRFSFILSETSYI